MGCIIQYLVLLYCPKGEKGERPNQSKNFNDVFLRHKDHVREVI
jgi:hypothetical protein